MARIRTIKPSFWSDPKVAGLSRDARLMLVGLISSADDSGRFLASSSAVVGYVFPHDNIQPKDIKKWKDEISGSGIVEFYRVGGLEFGHFPNWLKHQKINRPQRSQLPSPPSDRLFEE